jgi:nicotinamide-nucleotide amidase
MNAELIAIGDELLFGQTLDTNSQWIARALSAEGIAVRRVSVVPDDSDVMREAFQAAFQRSDVVLITGGLGPTHDDQTKSVLANFFDLPIVFRNDILEQVRRIYEDKQLDFIETSREQAEFPEGAIPMPNSHGTAPGIWIERDGVVFAAMPGVPLEMRGMMRSFVLPRLIKRQIGPLTLTRTLHTWGLAEAALYERLDNRKQILEKAGLAFLPAYTGVKLRLTVEANSREEGGNRLDEAESLVRDKLNPWIFGVGEDLTLSKGVGELLKKRAMRIAVAESCTGGLLAKQITDTPGSSGWFERGFVTYSNEAKHELLDVSMELIEQHGAVSAEVAEAMAKGALEKSRADVALSITGIAGPDGGTEEKPVGLVFIGLATADDVIHRRYVLHKERDANRQRSAAKALMMLLDELNETTEEDGQERLL